MKLILALLLALPTWATTLTGTLNNPDGTGANGTLYFALSQQASLTAAGGCGGPILVEPTYQIAIKVISGALQSPPAIYGNDCLLPNGTYYNITFNDTNGNLLFTDRWLISGSSINIGQIVSTVISGTTTILGAPSVILGTPTGAQTITQPSTTALTINTFTVTGTLVGPGTMGCTSAGCSFGAPAAFVGGLGTGSSSSSTLYIGTGNFYIRTFVGAPSCSGVLDGWLAMRTDVSPPVLYMCVGSNSYRLVSTL